MARKQPAAAEIPLPGEGLDVVTVTCRLAEFFGVDPYTFVEYAGGDGQAVDGERLRGLDTSRSAGTAVATQWWLCLVPPTTT